MPFHLPVEKCVSLVLFRFIYQGHMWPLPVKRAASICKRAEKFHYRGEDYQKLIALKHMATYSLKVSGHSKKFTRHKATSDHDSAPIVLSQPFWLHIIERILN